MTDLFLLLTVATATATASAPAIPSSHPVGAIPSALTESTLPSSHPVGAIHSSLTESTLPSSHPAGAIHSSLTERTIPLSRAAHPEDGVLSMHATRAAAEGTLITEQPDGTATTYSRDGIAFIVMYGMAFEQPDNSSAVTVVDGEDGYVYIGHPYASIVTNSWLKGRREDDRIVVDLPQLIYQNEYDGEMHDFYAYCMELGTDEATGSPWYYPSDNQQLVFNITENGFTLDNSAGAADTEEANTFLFGLCDSEGGWTGHGDIAQNYVAYSPEIVTVPTGAKETGWQLRSGDSGHFITYAASGDDIFVKGFSKDFPDAWVKATRTADGVHFANAQFVGIDEATQHYNYLCGAGKETFWSEEYEMEFTRNILADNMDFTAEGDMLTIETNVLVNRGLLSYNPIATYTTPVLRPTPEEVAPYPANPTLNTLIAYEPDWGYGVFIFNLPALNMDGYILPTDRMSYMIYMDGEPWPLYADEYPGLPEEETWLLPYDYNDGQYILSMGAMHQFYYFADNFDTIGVQSVYEGEDGQLFGSQLVYYDLNPDGVTLRAAEEKEIVAEEWYDLAGVRLSAPAGLCIRVVRYADGSVKTSKCVSL